MVHNVILIADPGIDGAFAIALALHDPNLNLLGIAATAGNVRSEQATRNVHIVVGHIDPPRWPRLGAALPVEYQDEGTRLHGPTGLGNTDFPCAQPHNVHPSDKIIIDLVRQYPREVTVVALGPLTVLARAFDRDPELPALIQRVICVGGAWHEPGNATAVAEFHFHCDPEAARQVLRSEIPLTLIPLDINRKVLFSPRDLLDLPAPESRTCQFLRKIVPFGIGSTSSLYGIEGFHLKDVLGIVAVSMPAALTTRPVAADVETRGELTRGMSVIDARTWQKPTPNVDLAIGVDVDAVRAYISQTLERSA